MQIDKKDFLEALGGESALSRMTDAERDDALDQYLLKQLNTPPQVVQSGDNEQTPLMTRRGTGNIFGDGRHVPVELAPMPQRPTIIDFFRLRMGFSSVRHLLQSAEQARVTGASDDLILACLLHDVGQSLVRADHGWWSAQMIEPYVSEEVTFAARYHQALRFFPDETVGYTYPEAYLTIFGREYEPEQYLLQAHEFAKNHRWYMTARMVTVNDLYAFNPNSKVSLDPFIDIIQRGFRQPSEGLGNDNSPSAHMWRSLMFPDRPL